jgi:UDP-N-acetylglucosamine transferase subunit ALG13
MIFLTVGTQLPFDRLVKAVDEAAGRGMVHDEVFAQIGESDYQPTNFKFAKSLGKAEYDDCMARASAIIGHAGMGTIISAMNNRKPLLVMPRLRRFGEAVNDHQMSIATQFERMGYLLVAYDAEQVVLRLPELPRFVPAARQTSASGISERISRFLRDIGDNRDK